MACNTRIVRTGSADPWWNLAVEEYLLGQAAQGETILYLWQNDSTVMVGRNQYPRRECRTDLLESDGGRLARRLSGGGAVYSDLGNLNYTFITGSGAYDLERQLGVVLKAAGNLGIAADKSGRYDLAVDGRKFSSSTLCFRKSSACHQGTIYVSTDMDKLSRYLCASSEYNDPQSDNSMDPRVVNLSELMPGLDVETVAEAMISSFRNTYESTAEVENCLRRCTESRAALEDLYCKYSSWVWRYGKGSDFDTSIETKFPWGRLGMAFRLDNNTVIDAAIYSDAMDADYIEGLAAALKDCRFNPKCLADRVDASAVAGQDSPAADPDPDNAAADPDPDNAAADLNRDHPAVSFSFQNAAEAPDISQSSAMAADIVKWLRTLTFTTNIH